MNIKAGILCVSLGVIIGASYNTKLDGPWVEDLSILHSAYEACESNRKHIADLKKINPERFNTCTIHFYYDVTESTETGRYMKTFTADTSNMMWIGSQKRKIEEEKRDAEIAKKLAEEDKRASVPRM